jgi:hypothetical protein
MANLKISQLTQRTPDGQEYFEVIIPPFAPGDNRKVLLSDLATYLLPLGIETVTPDVSGSPIDLPMTSPSMIYILGNLGVIKTFTFTGSVSKVFYIKIPITALVALTFPASVVMADSRWDGTAWTPLEIGTYYGRAFYDGANWDIQIPQLPSV